MAEATCPDCGYEFDTASEPAPSSTNIAAGCRDCGAAIAYGEWHVHYDRSCDRTPPAVGCRITAGRPDDGYRLCADCQDEYDSNPFDGGGT